LGAWENQAADFNNDGFVDIFSEMSKELYINNGNMTFTGMDLPFDEGAIADLNNDGFLDIVNDGQLWINEGNSNNNWVKVILKGTDSNLNGIGARVDIFGTWGKQMREVRSGQGFSHMSSLTAHFGIGTSTEIDKITITWPSGTVDEIINPDINTLIEIEEGSSPLSIEDNQAELLKLYPNPTASILNFSKAGLENTAVQIVDITGKIIMNTTISSENTLNVEALKSGVYFVQFKLEQQNVSYKFIRK